MEVEGTANQLKKDWRKQGLGWVPDYPDERDYRLDSEEIQKIDHRRSNSGNLRRNEVTKSIEDIAENLIQLIENLEKLPGQESLGNLKSTLENQIFGEVKFVTVKVYGKSLKFGIARSPKVRQLKYYFHLLSSHPSLSASFQAINFFKNQSEYWQWLNSDVFDENTQRVVEAFQKQVYIRVDGTVGVETYTAIGNFLGNINHVRPLQDTPLVNLQPIPVWIKESTFQIIFDTLKSSWMSFTVPQDNKEIAWFFPEILEPKDRQNSNQFPSNFFEVFKKEFYLIEPLVSAITEIISPFAIQDDVEYALKTALNKFENFDRDLGNSTVRGAILKIADRLKIEIEERESLSKTDPEKLKIITFYKIIQVIVQGYITKYNLTGDQKLLNLFSPSYLFEIEEDEKDKADSIKQFNLIDAEDIIPNTKLSVLVNRKWYEQSKKDLAVKERKPYAILPSVVDLSSWCSPIRDQGSLNSCTAFAAVALLEYFARKAREEYTYISPLFLYKVARNLMNSTGDVGASVRETMRAMVAFGVPPEKYWSYEEDRFDEEPPAFCYSYAQNYKTLIYFRLDRPDLTKEILLFQIQAVLAADFPCIFGFTVYSSIYDGETIRNGCISYPSKRDRVIGGHTVLAVGYNNYKKIKHLDGKGEPTTGAFLIRNSWGTDWGQKGYGWLPYEYVLKGLTADWWSLVKAEWFEAGNFGLGAHAPKDTEPGQDGTKKKPNK